MPPGTKTVLEQQVARCKEKDWCAHIKERRLMSGVITWRSVINDHEKHRNELDVIKPSLPLHFRFSVKQLSVFS